MENSKLVSELISSGHITFERIDIYFQSKYGAAPAAEVSWASYGAVAPEDALKFAASIVAASRIAEAAEAKSKF